MCSTAPRCQESPCLFPRLPEHSFSATPEAVAGAVCPQTPALQSRYRRERSPRLMERCGLQTAHRRASLSPWPLGCVVHILQERETFARKRVHPLLPKTVKKKKKKKSLENFPSRGSSQLFSYSDIFSPSPQLNLSHKSLKVTDS